MWICHLSDLHLGFSRYERQEAGVNRRERDVEFATSQAIDKTIEQRPEVVLICGDIFERAIPGPLCVVHAMTIFRRLREALPDAIIVIIGGNHDLPRSLPTSMLRTFEAIGIHVVDREPKRLAFPTLDLSVLAVPDAPGMKRIRFTPDPNYGTNVLAIHASVMDAIPGMPASEDQVTTEELNFDQWQYVAIGDHHVRHDLAPNGGYCGATEYTSTDIWGEVATEKERGYTTKGFLMWDTETKERTWIPLSLKRRVVDLPPINAAGKTPKEVDALIAAAVATLGDLDTVIARLILQDIPRSVEAELDHKAMRGWKAKAAELQIRPIRPEASPFAVMPDEDESYQGDDPVPESEADAIYREQQREEIAMLMEEPDTNSESTDAMMAEAVEQLKRGNPLMALSVIDPYGLQTPAKRRVGAAA